MSAQILRVGIVGVQPPRSWSVVAHVPALGALHGSFEIAGVANTSFESAKRGQEAIGAAAAFASVEEMVASSAIDVVAVSVKTPHHCSNVKAAIAAGKHVFCEWPLGKTLTEAVELAELAKAHGVKGVIGTQALVAPEVMFVKQLVADGYVGEVLSTTLIGAGTAWGPSIDSANAYLLDRANGATLLSIPVGHTLAAVQDVLGPVVEVSARLCCRRTSAKVVETGEVIPTTSPDQVLVEGLLASGAPLSLHYQGDTPRGVGLLWHIHGANGDLQVTAASGFTQLAQLTVHGSNDGGELRALTVPSEYARGLPTDPVVGNVARLYALMAADLRTGTSTAPSFDDAVALHRLLDAVETADREGRRVKL